MCPDPVALALVLASAMRLMAAVPLHDFADVSLWTPNQDGGNAPEVSVDTEHAREGAAMRIRYVDRPPHWGNLTGPCQAPGEARALRFWVCKHSAAREAAMHIWLMEPDGDAWVQKVPFGGKDLAEVPVGWHEVRMPVSAFQFEPRGQKTREMTRVNRMLIGSNFGDLEVTIDSMTWETGPGQAALPLPKTEGLKIESRERGSVGILDLTLDERGRSSYATGKTAHPPARLAEALRAGGFGVTILKAGDLADAAVLTPDSFAVVVLPFGPTFPLGARDAFLAYLKAGGSFLSTDGYAFDQLVVLTEGGWSVTGPERTAAEMDQSGPAPEPPRMNTRFGQPGDAMTFQPQQIGVFDPCFPLEHATRLRLAGPYRVVGDLRYDLPKPVEGFSACGLIGVNSPVFPPVYRRWVPVLEAFDGEGGALRGTALSIMHNHAGEYPRSSWAFSGITSGDDILLGDPKRRELLCRVVGDLTEKVFLHELATDFACYERGETAKITVKVSNNGRRPAERIALLSAGGRQLTRKALRLEPGTTETIEASVAVGEFSADYVPVKAELLSPSPPTPLPLGEGQGVRDVLESAFCVRSQAVLASGPKIGWQGNSMTVDGRATFLIGSNQTGMVYYSPHETPLVWDRDFRMMAEHGFHLLRILHFSPFAKNGYQGDGGHSPLDLASRSQRLVRQMDAIVQLAQKHRVAIFLSLHDWMGVGLTEEELRAQADWDRFWAERYQSAPGIFYDVQNEPGVDVPDRPDIVALWNQFLQQRHGSDDALQAAWTKHLPEAAMPNVPLGPTSNDWYDVRSADRKRFEAVVLNRWVKANVDGIRAGNPKALACVGYLPSMPPADKILGVEQTDLSNMHYYGSVDGFPLEFGLTDRRFVGKGLSLGECGAQEAHDARIQGQTSVPVAESIQRFQTYVHYAVGMGGAFIGNWDWKDFDEMVFPWGLVHHSSPVTKPWLHTWEQEYLLLSLTEPAYEPPEVFILAPDSNRVGPRFDELNEALRRSVALMLDQRVNFGMANEESVEQLPASAKALIWPVPYCPADDTFDRVLAWVQAGGTLYLSGDISFDRTRQPTRTARRAQLGLPEAEPRSPFETPEATWGQPPVETTVGQGKVLYAPYPLELRGQARDGQVYRRALELAGVAPTPIEPAEAPVRVLSIPTQGGGRLYMLARTSGGDGLLSVKLPQAGVSVELIGRGFSFVLVGAKREVLAAESQGEIAIGGELVAKAKGHFALCSLDGKDLRQSRQLLVLPHQCERVELLLAAHMQGARCTVGLPTDSVKQTSPAKTTLAFSPGTPGQVGVIAPAAEMEAAVGRVRARLMLR